MSEHNKELDNNQENQSKPKGFLEYDFIAYPGNGEVEEQVLFRIQSQHPAITEFLKQQPGWIWTAGNGYRVSLGVLYPEWKMSQNIVFLDGTNGRRLKKLDITRFPIDGRVYRDGQMALVKEALAELVEVVKDTFKDELRLKPQRRNARIVLA